MKVKLLGASIKDKTSVWYLLKQGWKLATWRKMTFWKVTGFKKKKEEKNDLLGMHVDKSVPQSKL